MANNQFRKIVKFYYGGHEYQMFKNQHNKVAFLRIENGKFYYPELETTLELVKLFEKKDGIFEMKDDKKKIQFYKFIPKVIYAGVVVTLTTSLLTGCGKAYNNSSNSNYSTTTTQQTIDFPDFDLDNPQSNEQTIVADNELEAKYLEYLAPADDEIDFRYKSDYEYYDLVKLIKAKDSVAFDQIYGTTRVTINDIKEACNNNKNISQKYKEFIINFVTDWENLYPGSDFRVLYNNLKTLRVIEATEQQITTEAMAPDALAVYIRSQNAIYVRNDLDVSKGSEGYIILSHEMGHAMRNATYELSDGTDVNISFYDYYKMGLYAEEGLITNFAYDLQGLGNKAEYYSLQSSYFRIIMDCTGYNGADYTNHSINYLMDMMDDYMGDEQYAYHIIALIDAEASLHYTSYAAVDYTEFSELHDYILRMYMKKHLNANMSYSEAMELFQTFVSEIRYNFEVMKNPYDITEDTFIDSFKEMLNDLGIQKSKVK